MIVWCIDVLHEILNDVKVRSNIVFSLKGNIVLRLLLGYIDMLGP